MESLDCYKVKKFIECVADSNGRNCHMKFQWTNLSTQTHFHLFSLFSFILKFTLLFFSLLSLSFLSSPLLLRFYVKDHNGDTAMVGATDTMRRFKEQHRPYEGGSVRMVDGKNRKVEEEVKTKERPVENHL